MYFLETVAGCSGEELVSAVFKYLLVQSDVLRKHFLDGLRHRFPASKFPSFRNGIVCQTEYPTDDEEPDHGLIDILITADNAVLAIENKLWARFQDNQPRKYLGTLQRKEKDIYKIIVIAPRDRHSYVSGEVGKQEIDDHCILLDWEDIVDTELKAVRQSDSEENRVIASFLKEYIESWITNYAVDVAKEKLVGHSVAIGNPYQRDFLYKMQGLFGDWHHGKMASGKEHIGFIFYLEEDQPDRWNWLGFIRGDDGRLRLILTTYLTDFTPTKTSDVIRVHWAAPRKTQLHIDFPESTRTMDDWRNLLEPIKCEIKSKADAKSG